MQKSFPWLFGNEQTKSRLASAIFAGTLPHALLISGPRGSGKHTLAKSIAAALNCERRGEPSVSLPCCSCIRCQRIKAGKFTDFKVLAKDKSKATIGAAEIRYFREDMFLSATESEYKIYVIENCECITTQGQNALLKVLEEPPERVMIILLTESVDKLLSTIKSRVQQIRMECFDNEALKEALPMLSEEALALSQRDPDAYEQIVFSAGGNIGEACRLLDKTAFLDARQMREDTELLIGLLNSGKGYADVLGAISALPKSRGELFEIFESVTVALRDLILLKSDKNAPLIYYTDRESALALSARIPKKRLFLCYDTFRRAIERNHQNANISSISALIASGLKQ